MNLHLGASRVPFINMKQGLDLTKFSMSLKAFAFSYSNSFA